MIKTVSWLSAKVWKLVRLVRDHYLTALSATIAGLLIWQATSTEVVFDSIDVPTELSEKGFSSKLVTARLVDEIISITKFEPSLDVDPRSTFRLQSDEIDIQLPGGGATLQSALAFFRHVIGTEHLRIAGELRMEKGGLDLRLRSNKTKRFAAVRVSSETVDLDGLLKQAARKVMAQLDPLILVQYLLDSGKESSEALPIIQASLADPNRKNDIQALLAMCLYALQGEKKGDEAISCAKRVLLVDPKSAQAHTLWAYAAADQNKHQEAVEHAGRALALDPTSADAYFAMGHALEQLKRIDEAIAILTKGMAKSRSAHMVFIQLHGILRNEGRHADIVTLGDKYYDRLLDKRYYYWFIGRAMVAQGRAEEGIGLIKMGIDLAAPNNGPMARGYLHLAEARMSRGNNEAAVADFRQATLLAPTSREAKLGLAKALEKSGQILEATSIREEMAGKPSKTVARK